MEYTIKELSAIGAVLDDPQFDRRTALHRQWICGYWAKYDPAAHRALAQAYVDDPLFTAYYDGKIPGCARFLRDAILAHIK